MEVIPIIEEELHVDERKVTTGKVRVRTIVDVIDELASASLEEETVEVTRVPVDRAVDRAPDIRTENGVTIIPVMEEVLVLEKRLVLKEELHVRKRISTEEVEYPVQRRRQRAIIERIPADKDDANNSS
jgi:stress response protein YsnF